MKSQPSTLSVAGTSKAATVGPNPPNAVEDEASTSSSGGSTPTQQQKEKQLVTIYQASLEQCKQLFGANCSVKLERCEVPSSNAPVNLGSENNADGDTPSAQDSGSRETGSCTLSNGENVLPVPPVASLCRVCGKMLASKAYLKVHMRKHTGEKRYRCEYCGRSFWESSALTKHKKARSQRNGVCPLEKKFGGRLPKGAWECKICGKKLKYPDSYLPHIKRHGIKPLKCGVCGKGFTLSCELSKHMRIHSGVWKHSCIFCDKGFHQKADLFQHLRGHTNEKPHFCRVKGCGASFRQLKSLRRHRRRIHLKED